jgi:lipoprotein-anchoring transpeptidase ErfK/SrfK
MRCDDWHRRRDFAMEFVGIERAIGLKRQDGWAMRLRAIAFVIIGLMLGGCMQETVEPASQAGWTARDKELMSNLPYAQADIPVQYRRTIVDFTRKEAPGSIVVDEDHKFLYYVLPDGKAIRYGITVGEEAQAWSGIAKVDRMAEWPAWVPTAGEQARLGPFPAFVTGGPQNPMGARALYLYSNGKDTGYRIHGTNQPEYIGQAISSGCIRMTNENVIDLYRRVHVGTIVVVLKPTTNLTSEVAASGPISPMN